MNYRFIHFLYGACAVLFWLIMLEIGRQQAGLFPAMDAWWNGPVGMGVVIVGTMGITFGSLMLWPLMIYLAWRYRRDVRGWLPALVYVLLGLVLVMATAGGDEADWGDPWFVGLVVLAWLFGLSTTWSAWYWWRNGTPTN